MIDPKLITLLSVSETYSYTKTAEKLNLTQPAISNHIHQLERELGVKIINRQNHDLTLTEEGKIVVRYAKRISGIYGNMERELSNMMNNIKRLSVGVTPSAENNIVCELLARYGVENADICFTVISNPIDNLYLKLKSYEIDLAIVEGRFSSDNLKRILLDTDQLVLAVSNDNPLSRQSSVTLEELMRERIIMRLPSSGTRTLFETNLHAAGYDLSQFQIVMEIDNISTIKDLVAHNYGVSILARSVCVEDVRRRHFAIVPIKNLGMPREINLYYNPDFAHEHVLTDIQNLYVNSVK